MTLSRSDFLGLLAGSRPLVSDGAMGTMLHKRGVAFEECFDQLNLTNPAVVAEIHREYIDAGAQIVQTNTFGANRYKLDQHGMRARVGEINAAGVELARRVVMASFKDVLIAGDIGPLGVRLAPFGRVQLEQARAAFSEQISALADAGADLLIIETMTDLYELREAVEAARHVAPHLPVIASMTFTRDDRTLLGDEPAKVARKIAEAGADMIGVNCSGGPNQILRILKLMRQAVPDGLFSVMPNAGWPEQVSGRIMYPAAPDYFIDYTLALWQAGANLIGGCCGTTPEHIGVIRHAIESTPPEKMANGFALGAAERDEPQADADAPTQLAEKLAAGQFVIAVEMDPPRGLSTHKLLAVASLLADSGVDVIDVADSPMARMRMSPWAVCNLIQRKVGIETVLHFPTRGRNLLRVQGDLLAAYALGVRNVFVVMGDPTAIGDYPEAMDNYDLVPSGLIKLIKQGFNAGLDHAGSAIGQPTSFFVSAALNLLPPDPEAEIKNLRRKLRAGADYLLTQPVFDAPRAIAFLDRLRADVGVLPPVLVGIMPLATGRHAAFLHHEVPGIEIPEAIRERMNAAGEDGQQEGIRVAVEIMETLRPYVQGMYLMPQFSRYDTAAAVVDAVKNSGK